MPVFLSYAHEDRKIIDDTLIPALEIAQVAVWHDHHLPNGRNVPGGIVDGIRNCYGCILVATPSSMASTWCSAEVSAFVGMGYPVFIYCPSDDIVPEDLPPLLRGANFRGSVSEIARLAAKARHDTASNPTSNVPGIRHIRPKYQFSPDYWDGVLSSASSDFILVGHSASKWCDYPYRDAFRNTLLRLVQTGGNVRILILHPDGSALKARTLSTGINCELKIQVMLDFLRDHIVPYVAHANRHRLRLHLAHSSDIPYMLIKADDRVLVSHYFAHQDNKDCILLELGANTRHGAAYLADVEGIFRRAPPLSVDQLLPRPT